ncbi:MAG TPA: pseudouridylate synthase [Verrucomicrobia bacterium]|nr:pseudouridylate synthase [Verrucomicrobiota bacterium]|tara:strand:- start:2077 stop:2808 length:732 start_codon:yes stop_codon:yes gene_type:complete
MIIERLSKIMASRGMCSRREADRYIERGLVRVDGIVVDQLGSKISHDAKIVLSEEGANEQAQQATFLLNKPIGYVSGQPEEGYRPAVALIEAENRWKGDLLKKSFGRDQLNGLAPAGRLDIDSKGLLVMTQNGRIARQLIGADSSVDKEYLVRVRGEVGANDLKQLCHGLQLDGKPLKPAKVSRQNRDQLRFVLREGKKRQIRRMCELVGLKVVGLKRIRIGRVQLDSLPEGQWRYLGNKETF